MSAGHSLCVRTIGRIPVRNVWLLMLYASDLARYQGTFKALVEADTEELPDLVARLLCCEVERRLKRNLTHGYRHRSISLTRVRGRIDPLVTVSRQLMSKGEIFCRAQELTANTPRNRLVRCAASRIAAIVKNCEVAQQCRSISLALGRLGVECSRPSRNELAVDQTGRNDTTDRMMMSLALLAFDLSLPTEESGLRVMPSAEREEAWIRRLFEKAVVGFARAELTPLGWRIRGRVHLHWQTFHCAGADSLLPRMETDMILDHPGGVKRTVVDMKFASIVEAGRFGSPRFKSGYLYQMYAYLRSQEGKEAGWKNAAGLFVHPAIGASVLERVTIQGHAFTFGTVDLSDAPSCVRAALRKLLLEASPDSGDQ